MAYEGYVQEVEEGQRNGLTGQKKPRDHHGSLSKVPLSVDEEAKNSKGAYDGAYDRCRAPGLCSATPLKEKKKTDERTSDKYHPNKVHVEDLLSK